jgi:serine/threonine protein kinase/Tol biopolymer transport system component
MTPERWQRIEQVYFAALTRAPAQRAAWLDEACKDDAALRREVESLLVANEHGRNFLAEPALEVVAQQLALEPSLAQAGQVINHYQILSPLGQGGMGVVYKALDLRLGRAVALKMLSPALVSDQTARLRFLREARAASMLAHPNICTVFEVGQKDDLIYIAMQYLPGRTLADLLSESPLSLQAALGYALDIADALDEAHRRGIIHRDIKPTNIIINERDRAVVLDFGLAKYIGAPRMAGDEAPTLLQITEAISPIGTPAYMSPEQVRGERLDERSDIFSFGVMLYEMVAGRRPFGGHSQVDTLHAILYHDPTPLDVKTGIPARLDELIRKTLAKDANQRWQSFADLKAFLSDLQNRLDRSSHQAGFADFSRAPAADAATIATSVVETDQQARATSGNVTARLFALSTQRVFGIVARNRKMALAMVAVLIIAMALAIFSSVLLKRQPMVLRLDAPAKLTDDGRVISVPPTAAISPDGKYVAYPLHDAATQSLHVLYIPTHSDRVLIAPADVEYYGVTFSPDSNHLYYVIRDKQGNSGLFQVAALGGNPRRLMTDVDLAISFSPDGKQFAFVSRGSSLMIANADGTDAKLLATRPGEEAWRYPVWSPDGKVIACALLHPSSSEMRLTAVRVADGNERPIPSQVWEKIFGLAWLADGRSLILSAADRESGKQQLWTVVVADGKAEKITRDLSDYYAVSLTADSGSLVSVRADEVVNLWIAPPPNTGKAKRITYGVGKNEGAQGLSGTPDGRIVYSAGPMENNDIWIIDADGRNPRQLTFDKLRNTFPVVTADGQYIVFVSGRGGGRGIWRMDLDGNNAKKLTSVDGMPYRLQGSPDGKWVVYQVNKARTARMWKLSIEGGEPVLLVDEDAERPTISPDGKLLAYMDASGDVATPKRVKIIPLAGGPTHRAFDLQCFGTPRHLRWTPDGKALAYVDDKDGADNIWRQPIDGGPPTPLTDFDSDRIAAFAWTANGKQLICSRISRTADVVLQKNQTP